MSSWIVLGDDPWSARVIKKVEESAHQETLKLWAAGKPVTEYDTPYVQYMKEVKGARGRVASRMQRAFYELSREKRWRNPITFQVRDDGELHCLDGFHRLNITHHRGLPLVAKVVERDEGWHYLRERVQARMQSNAWKGKLYHPIPHPDFRGFPIHHPTPPPLLEFVKQHEVRSALDVGCHFGWSLYSLRSAISEGVGVDIDPITHRVASLVLGQCGMQAVNEDVLRYLQKRQHFDLVLALNVLHHVPLDKTLALLRARYVAFSLPTPEEAGSRRLPNNPYEYVRQRLRGTVMLEDMFEGRILVVVKVGE